MDVAALLLAFILFSFSACNLETGSAEALNDSNSTVSSDVTMEINVDSNSSADSNTSSKTTVDTSSNSGTNSAPDVTSSTTTNTNPVINPGVGGNIVTVQGDSVPTPPAEMTKI